MITRSLYESMFNSYKAYTELHKKVQKDLNYIQEDISSVLENCNNGKFELDCIIDIKDDMTSLADKYESLLFDLNQTIAYVQHALKYKQYQKGLCKELRTFLKLLISLRELIN